VNNTPVAGVGDPGRAWVGKTEDFAMFFLMGSGVTDPGYNPSRVTDPATIGGGTGYNRRICSR